MEKEFYIKLQNEQEYKACLQWFRTNILSEDVSSFYVFIKDDWVHFGYFSDYWRLIHKRDIKDNYPVYTWDEFIGLKDKKESSTPSKLIPGRWYTSCHWSLLSALKFSHFDEDLSEVHGTEAYMEKESQWDGIDLKYRYWSNRGDIVEIPNKDLVNYLPSDHPDLKTQPEIQPMEDLVGRYIKALVNQPNSGRVKAGEYGLITKMRDSKGSLLLANFPSQNNYEIVDYYRHPNKYQLMPKGWIPDAEKPEELEQDKLLEKAKRDYPIGTHFYPAHISNDNPTDYCIVTTNEYEVSSNGGINAIAKDKSYSDGRYCKSDNSSEGNTCLHRMIYSTEHGWAKIKTQTVVDKPKSAVNKFLEKNNFKKGEIYYIEEFSGNSWIIRFDGMDISMSRNYEGKEYQMINHTAALSISGYSFYKESNAWGSSLSVKVIREASYEEKAWFGKCIKAGKYVDEVDTKSDDVIPCKPTFAECIEKFHVGVSFCNKNLGVGDGKILTINKPPQQNDFIFVFDEIWIEPNCLDYQDWGSWTIWKDGEWADITSITNKSDIFASPKLFKDTSRKRRKIEVVKKQIKKLTTIKQ